MGLFVGGGDALADMLMNQQANCEKCGAVIKFESGAGLAKECGITDNVVMCAKCKSVFNVELVPGKMTLTQNVSDRYKAYIKNVEDHAPNVEAHAPVEVPAPKSFSARLGGVYFAPREAFHEIGLAPRILLPIIALILIGSLSAWYITTKVDVSALMAAQTEKAIADGRITEEQAAQQAAAMGQAPKSLMLIFAVVTGGIGTLILCLLIAAYGKIFSMITGAENNYISLWEVSIYAMLATSIVSTILTVAILQIKAPGSELVYETPHIASNLGAIIEVVAEEDALPKFIMNLAQTVDIFVIWTIALLSIGFSAVSKKLKTSTAAIWLGGIYAIFAVLQAALQSISFLAR